MMPYAKYFFKNLIWVTNCMNILFEFNKNFKITMKMANNQIKTRTPQLSLNTNMPLLWYSSNLGFSRQNRDTLRAGQGQVLKGLTSVFRSRSGIVPQPSSQRQAFLPFFTVPKAGHWGGGIKGIVSRD